MVHSTHGPGCSNWTDKECIKGIIAALNVRINQHASRGASTLDLVKDRTKLEGILAALNVNEHMSHHFPHVQ